MASKEKGFTLVELLVVIAIIAVLGAVATIVFTNVQRSARDAKRKADVDSISKAYEVKYPAVGSYQAVSAPDFLSKVAPQPPQGGDYYNVVASDGSGYKVCAALEGHPYTYCNSSSNTCFCKVSVAGTISTGSIIIGTGSEIGVGSTNLTHPSSCDPNGTLDDGLAGYWKVDEGSETILNDISGNNNDGTIYGGTWGACKLGNCVGYNGTSDYISAPNSNSLNIGSLIDNFTVSLWVNVINKAAVPMFVNKGTIGWNTGTGSGGWEVGVCGSSTQYLCLTISDGTNIASSGLNDSDNLFNALVWYHMVAVRDASNHRLKVYVNGSLKSDIPDPTVGSLQRSDSPLVFARKALPSPPASSLNGGLDDIRIYNRVLTSDEINHLYNNYNGCTPP